MNALEVRKIQEVVEQPVEPLLAPGRMITIGWMISTLLRRWKSVAAVAGVIFVLVCIAGLAGKPRYEATALLMMNAQKQSVLGAADQMMNQATPDSALVDSRAEVLKSPKLIGALVDKLRLTERREYGGRPNAKLSPAEKNQLREDVIARVDKAISVSRQNLSYVLEVTARASDPKEAALLANSLVEVYFVSEAEDQGTTSNRANSWLSERLEELRTELQQKEDAAEAYRSAAGLLSAEGSSLTEQQTAQLQTQVVTARADMADRQARYAQVRQIIQSGESADSIVGALQSDVIRDLRARAAEAERNLADANQRYGPKHPSVVNGQIEVQNVNEQIRIEVNRIATGLRNEVGVASERVRALEVQLSTYRGQLSSNNAALVKLRQMERDAAATRTVYESFLQRYHQIADQARMRATDMELVSSASEPAKPAWPKKPLVLMAAIVLGLGIGVGATILLEMIRGRLTSADDVERAVGLPAITSVPTLRASQLQDLPEGWRHPGAYILEKPMSSFAESIRVLRTAFVYSPGGKKVQTLAITSAVSDEGKTTLSLCLSRITALSGQRVLLVDCDLRRRSLSGLLGIDPEVGLLQVLVGDAEWRQALVTTDPSGMHVLPVAANPFTPLDVFGTNEMNALIDEWRANYDVIIFDCPPVLAVAETRILVQLADRTALLARWDRTPAQAVSNALEQIEQAGGNVLGIVLNCVDERAPGRSSFRDALYYRHGQNAYYSS